MPQNPRKSFRTVILICDYGDLRGGLEKVAVQSATGLREMGYEVVFLCAVGPAAPELADSDVNVVCLNIPDLLSNNSRIDAALKGIWNRQSARSLSKIISQYDLETTIVHVHGWTKALSPSIISVVTRPNVRHVFTAHEYFLACPNGGFFDYQKHENCQRTPLGAACLATNCDQRSRSQKFFRVARQASYRSLRIFNRKIRNVIYISEMQRRIIAPFIGNDAELHYVPNPVDVTKKGRVRAENNSKFVFVGRLEPVKGTALVAQAARDTGSEVVFVGDGAERARILEINPDAQITGWLPPESVSTFLESAKAFLFPSLWQEPFGLAAYEALAQGIPVICGSWNAAAEAIEHGRNGFVATSTTGLGGFKDQMDALNAHENLASISEAAYELYWQRPFTETRHLQALTRVYAYV